MFRAMLSSLYETTKNHDIEVVAVIDNDVEAMKIANTFDVDALSYSASRRGALNAWNTGLFQCDGEILIPAGDDQLFHHGWLDFALESHEKKLNGYGVVGMNDLAYDGNAQVATMFLFDRKYCQEAMGGVFAPPVYKYYCVDSEWNEKAKLLGRFYWDERSKVEHLHSAHGKRPKDATDSYKEDAWMEVDNQTFQDRKSKGFPIEWEAMI